jgi:hypothetical protein
MPVRFLELTGTNNGNVDFFRNVIVAIFTVLFLVDLVVVVAGGLLLLRHYITTPRSGKLWLSRQRGRRAP